MPRLAEVFEQPPRTESRPSAARVKNIHYEKLVYSAYQYRDRPPEQVKALADLIRADGKVLEPCVVRKYGADTYELISGHRRCMACRYLVEEEGLEEFSFLPCIEEDLSDVRAEFAVYSSNGYDEKTPYEIMREIEGMSRLLKNHPEEFPETAAKGRLVEKLAERLQMSRSVISDYKNISHNLGEKGMEAFRNGALDKSAAVELASLPAKTQEEILDKGLTSRAKIREYRQQEKEQEKEQDPAQEEDRPLPGQMEIKDYPEILPEGTFPSAEPVHSEGTSPSAEPVHSEGTSPSTEPSPSASLNADGQRIHRLCLDAFFFDDAVSGVKNFELRKNDRDYQVGDLLELLEIYQGGFTGRSVKKRITYVLKLYPGLEKGYCILGVVLAEGGKA